MLEFPPGSPATQGGGMHSKRFWPMLTLVAVLALVAAACGDEEEPRGPTAPTAPTGATATGPTATGPVEPCDTAAAGDLLERICSEGVIRVSTDPAYPPQSSLNEETGEYEGFDIDVANEIANRLGVEVDWQTSRRNGPRCSTSHRPTTSPRRRWLCTRTTPPCRISRPIWTARASASAADAP